MTTTRLRDGLLLRDVLLPRDGGGACPDAAEDLETHLARLGACPAGDDRTPDLLAGLTGRGGAGVPAELKWRSARGRVRTVVANASESELLSGKDATLVRQRPHLVLDGLVLAAQAVGADRAVVWLHDDDRGLRGPVERALAERLLAGLPGPRPEVVCGPSGYLSGESSAITRHLDGGPALPTFRLGRNPVLVQNAETLARAALRVRGRDVPRSLLTVLSSSLRHVLDVPASTTLRRVLDEVGWTHGTPHAVLLGGYGGQWRHWDDVADLAVGLPALRDALGPGIVAPLPPQACGIAETATVLRYLADQSARQCGPCAFGLPALADATARLARGGRRSDLRRLQQDAAAVEGRGACSHPDGATRLVTSMVDVFTDDLAQHRRGRPCEGAGHAWVPVPA